jgi:hypothetical protein
MHPTDLPKLKNQHHSYKSSASMTFPAAGLTPHDSIRVERVQLLINYTTPQQKRLRMFRRAKNHSADIKERCRMHSELLANHNTILQSFKLKM